jgi:hypothetical protein
MSLNYTLIDLVILRLAGRPERRQAKWFYWKQHFAVRLLLEDWPNIT